jgi:hypothetical protein
MIYDLGFGIWDWPGALLYSPLTTPVRKTDDLGFFERAPPQRGGEFFFLTYIFV